MTNEIIGLSFESDGWSVDWSSGKQTKLSDTYYEDLKEFLDYTCFPTVLEASIIAKELKQRERNMRQKAKGKLEENARWLKRHRDTMFKIQSYRKREEIHQKLLIKLLETAEVGRNNYINCDLGFVIVSKLPIIKSSWMLKDPVSSRIWTIKRSPEGLVDEILRKYYSFYNF